MQVLVTENETMVYYAVPILNRRERVTTCQRDAPDPSSFPEVKACHNILPVLVFIGIKDLENISSATYIPSIERKTYLSCRRMKHPDILSRQYVD